jgi:hypothetical protein
MEDTTEDDDDSSAISLSPRIPREFAAKIELNKQSNRMKARLYLAGVALSRLLVDFPQSRTDLFSPGGEHEAGIKALIKEGSARAWQTDFLEILVASGVANVEISKNGRSYTLADSDKKKLLVKNMLDGDQSGLKLLLWPKDYDAPTAAEIRAASDGGKRIIFDEGEEEEEALVEETQEPQQDEAVGVLDKVAGSLTEVAGHLGELYKANEKTNAITAESSVHLRALTERLEIGLKQLEVLANDEKRRIYGELGDLISKAAETEIRKKSLFSQLESESRRSETTIQKIKELLIRVT